ncbi:MULTISPECIES: hypothetical protein [unclassified Streptomyces]|uniref:hypothetical protein n=1 Tax=unclassified Streptomyces TaxID=2593676 RepID=UPI002030183B|nr:MULTISPECIES: hypothetical protein [unclassified Streptomyces]MCM1967618.1 hypothetical protein [Streptomyces sp. G1]MCX5125954.1 hypothetical protein [Streptomyces sp. NBC_00347]MCX5298240.1 hypothetical protein [Streptomyces sp. NBC_00193]
MRSDLIALRVTGVAVALTALSAVTAPFAFAGEEDWNRDRGSVSADPNPAEPGAQVKLRVRGCDDDWAVAQSVVFVSEVRLSTGRDDRRTLWGDAMIRSWAEPGRHDIKIKCGGRGGEREWGTIEIERRREHRPDPHHTPVWPVHAGGGGMSEEIAAKSKAASAAEAAKAAGQAGSADSEQLAAAAKKSHTGDGPGLPHTVIGAVLAAAATLAVAGRALTLRRRRSGE